MEGNGRNVTEKELYRGAVEQIKAPEYLRERVKRMEGGRKKGGRPIRRLVYAAAAAAVVFLSGNAVSYAATGNSLMENIRRSTFFYPSQEAADEARRVDGGSTNNISSVLTGELMPGETSEELTREEVYDLVFGIAEEDELVSDETGGDGDPWTRRLIRIREGQGVMESYSAEDAAKLTALYEPLAGWDLSWLGQHYTPMDKGQFLIMYKKESDGSLMQLFLDAVYGEEDGENFGIWATCQPGLDYGKDFVDEQKLDAHEYYTTADGVEVVIMQKGDQILADLTQEGFSCTVDAGHMTVGKVKELLDHMNLAYFVRALSDASNQ